MARKSVLKQMQSETRFLAQLCTFKWIERAIKEVTYFHKSTFRRFWLITAEERGLCLLPGNDVTFDSKGLSAKWRRCYFSFPCSFVCFRKPLDRLYFLLCAQQIRLFAERSIRAPLREDDTAEREIIAPLRDEFKWRRCPAKWACFQRNSFCFHGNETSSHAAVEVLSFSDWRCGPPSNASGGALYLFFSCFNCS